MDIVKIKRSVTLRAMTRHTYMTRKGSEIQQTGRVIIIDVFT